MTSIRYLFFWFLMGVSSLQAQQTTLDWPTFRQNVLLRHPEALRAALPVQMAEAQWRQAQGAFDVKAYADYEQKKFKGVEYFQHAEGGLKWATIGGLEFKTAYVAARGQWLNPEQRLPDQGQAVVGMRSSLLQGMFIDQRRAERRQAKIQISAAEAERQLALSDLTYRAAKVYWNWAYAETALAVYLAALEQADIRHQGTVERFKQGEMSAIDTIETYLQWQTRLIDAQLAQVERQNAWTERQVFWWDENETNASFITAAPPPAEPSGLLVEAAAQNAANLENDIRRALDEHPALQLYAAKLQFLQIEQRFKKEALKPRLDLDYYLLGSGWQFFPSVKTDGTGPAMLANDVKWGLSFSYPLQNRKARGAWQATQIKITDTDFAFKQKRAEMEAKIRQYAADLQNLETQAKAWETIMARYQALLEGEIIKFEQGESSVFMVNTREQKRLEAQIKWLKLKAEWNKASAAYLAALGRW